MPDTRALEWMPLKGRPYDYDDELQLMTVSGNVLEFENPRGSRYRCVKEDGVKQWFTLRSNQPMKRATRAKVKICCKKLQSAFGTFIDRTNGAGPVCIFPKRRGLTSCLSRQIQFCPWCGKTIQFLESEETERPRARAATAGQS